MNRTNLVVASLILAAALALPLRVAAQEATSAPPAAAPQSAAPAAKSMTSAGKMFEGGLEFSIEGWRELEAFHSLVLEELDGADEAEP